VLSKLSDPQIQVRVAASRALLSVIVSTSAGEGTVPNTQIDKISKKCHKLARIQVPTRRKNAEDCTIVLLIV